MAAKFYNQTYKIDYAKNVIERNLAVVAYAIKLPIKKEDIYHKLPFLYSSREYSFDCISSAKNTVLLIPGASYHSKIYPVEQYARLTKQIDANFLVIWGNEEEKLLAEQIKLISPNVNVMNKLSIDKLISLITQVNLVIGSDTGPTHMAWALNIPSITLFGPTPGYRNTLVTKINRIIESESEVNPYKINKKDFSINSIKVSDIVEISKHLLR